MADAHDRLRFVTLKMIASRSQSCTIEQYNETWSVVPVGWGDQRLWQEYDRPVYLYYGGNPFISDADAAVLIYSGDRWFGFYQPRWKVLFKDGPVFKAAVKNYHGK